MLNFYNKVADNTYSITIKSDINMDGKEIKDTNFVADYCKLDSSLTLRVSREYTHIETPTGSIINSEYFDIPLNIRLLLNPEVREFFSITKEK